MNFRGYGVVLLGVGLLKNGPSMVCPAVFASQAEPKVTLNGDREVSALSEADHLLENRRWNEAVQVLRVQVKKEPTSIPTAFDLATALAYLGQREEALQLLVQMSEGIKPALKKLVFERVHVISRLFLTNKTFQIFQDGMNLILSKKYRQAREKFEKALTEEPDNIEILLRIGQCLVLEGAIDKAMGQLQLAKKLNPFELEIKLWLGRALFQKGKWNESLHELHPAYNGLSDSELAPVWLAETYSALNQNKSALQILEKDIKAWPFHIVSLLTSARLRSQGIHVEVSHLWAARKDLQIALSRLSEYPTSLLIQTHNELTLDLTRSQQDLKTEIQRLLLQVEGRLNDVPLHRE